MFTHMPPKAVAMVAQHLLGDDPAATLAAERIKGIPRQHDACALAKHFQRFLPGVSVGKYTASLSDGNGFISLNEQCRSFVCNFDDGDYPNLVKKSGR
jgi:hypothetical protein